MPVPLEFFVVGRPASVNGCTKRKNDWKILVDANVKTALLKKIGFGVCVPKYAQEVTAKIFYFPHNRQYNDVDNGLKYTIDGLATSLLEDDIRVIRLVAERFPCHPGTTLLVPASSAVALAKAIDVARPRTMAEKLAGFKSHYATAVKIEDYSCNGAALW